LSTATAPETAEQIIDLHIINTRYDYYDTIYKHHDQSNSLQTDLGTTVPPTALTPVRGRMQVCGSSTMIEDIEKGSTE